MSLAAVRCEEQRATQGFDARARAGMDICGHATLPLVDPRVSCNCRDDCAVGDTAKCGNTAGHRASTSSLCRSDVLSRVELKSCCNRKFACLEGLERNYRETKTASRANSCWETSV